MPGRAASIAETYRERMDSVPVLQPVDERLSELFHELAIARAEMRQAGHGALGLEGAHGLEALAQGHDRRHRPEALEPLREPSRLLLHDRERLLGFLGAALA